ncbi:hypothetical protein NZD89_03465 [Alicyclobacillus fastidiosus]|uniref:Uncharacterized protein n=1 Tax=Alicyclobacillus fastidiosus TaxID=392011 RepID=A0ABY6ZKX8_9BACL|nr:hypothetical protein [Alicyclobacillus fastidiosus]WAH42560.1 hypothetical protein NZD89_03465 [Alicyclobacillus fastidiosus]GMA64413.1 hypothetical protein GCM10025859_48530 [Alicyclobacillus fastidiosus]
MADLAFQLLILSQARMNVLMFIFAGVLAYVIDYRPLRGQGQFKREALLVRRTALFFVICGTAILVLYQILFWLS